MITGYFAIVSITLCILVNIKPMITYYLMITEKSNRLQVNMITDYDYPMPGLVCVFAVWVQQNMSSHDFTQPSLYIPM